VSAAESAEEGKASAKEGQASATAVIRRKVSTAAMEKPFHILLGTRTPLLLDHRNK
jgi:hypothetical protein